MPKEPGYRWKLGLFATITLLLLVIAIFVIGRQKNLFGSVFNVSSVFKTVSGLKVGNNVRFGGIDVGTIDDIQIMTDTTVKVDMVVQSSVKRFIRRDAIASISSDGLMGDKVIVIAPGTPGQPEVGANEILQSRAPIETDQIMASLKVSADNAAIITTQLAELTSRINNGKGALGKLLKDTTLSTNLSSTMKNLKKSSEGLSENMEAAKHNFLLRGYFKKKEKEKKKKEEELKKQQQEKEEATQQNQDTRSKNK